MGSSKSVAAVGTAQDGGLSAQMVNTASGHTGQPTTVPNLDLLTKNGAQVAVTASFLTAGATGSDTLSLGVSAADGTLLLLQGQSVVSPCCSVMLLHQLHSSTVRIHKAVTH